MIYRTGTYAQRNIGGATILIPDSNATWIDVNGTVTTSLGKIVPSTTGTGWDKSGAFGSLPASTDGFVEFQGVYMSGHSSGGYAMCGLTTTTSGGSYTNIEYAMHLFNGTKIEVYESGSRIHTFSSAYVLTDVFRVERVGSTIYYKKNGTTFYTSLVTSTALLKAKCAIWGYLGFENLKIEY